MKISLLQFRANEIIKIVKLLKFFCVKLHN